MISIMDSLISGKRAIMAPLTYRRSKRMHLSNGKPTGPGIRPDSRPGLKFSEINSEIIFDVSSAPKLIRTSTNTDRNDIQQSVQCLIAAASSNIRLKMDLLGSRISNELELDNLLNTPEVGIQTMCESGDLLRVESMEREQLISTLIGIDIDFDEFDEMSTGEMQVLLKRCYAADLNRARIRRKEQIEFECQIRNILPCSSLMKNARLLRQELANENKITTQEEMSLVEIRAAVNSLDYSQCNDKLRELRHKATQNMLLAIGLSTDGTIQDREFRLDIFLHIRKRALLSASQIQPASLERAQLEAALEDRRIRIPIGASDHFLRKILTNAVLGELCKAPVKFPFGISRLTLEDLEDLGPFELRTMLTKARGAGVVNDIAAGDRDLLLQRLRITILQQNNDAYVKAIRTVLCQLKCFDVLADLDDDVGGTWTSWFDQLETCMKEMQGQALLDETNEFI